MDGQYLNTLIRVAYGELPYQPDPGTNAIRRRQRKHERVLQSRDPILKEKKASRISN